MFHPYELFIGLRYTRARRRNHFISFISTISLLGIALGVMALITVISVMNGFGREIRANTLSVASHATIEGLDEPLVEWRLAREYALKVGQVAAAAPYIRAEGMLRNGARTSGVLIRGILPRLEDTVSDIGDKLERGSLDALRPGEYGIILGHVLARNLGLDIGDKVTLVTSQANVSPVGIVPRLKRFTVVDIFNLDMYQFDRGLALIHIEDAARLYRMGKGVSGLRLMLDDPYQAARVVRELAEALPGDYLISDWTRQNAPLFKALKTEKVVMFVILALIVAVAAFNIVSTLVMVVTDKQADIAILRTQGATPGGIMLIFIVQGALIGFIGTFIGTLAGIALALNVPDLVPWLEGLLGYHFLPADVYQISRVPSELRQGDVARIALLSLSLSLLATLYPAWRASHTQPAEALRYE